LRLSSTSFTGAFSNGSSIDTLSLVHHQHYDGGDHYTVDEGEHPEVVTMDWWAMPAMIVFHLPLFIAVQYFTHIPSAWGGIAAVVVYFTLYESLHYVMHVPATMKKLSRYSWFRYIDNHHKIHHKYMLSNLNVILPLADYVLGTKRDETGKRIYLFGEPKKATKRRLASQTAKRTLPTNPVHMVK
jgi:sterol desaturase/sphingolipid hydroxylase (fatty acid hydroxylase superfamily)